VNISLRASVHFIVRLLKRIPLRSISTLRGIQQHFTFFNYIIMSFYLFIMKFVQLGTQIKTQCKKENIQKYTKSTL